MASRDLWDQVDGDLYQVLGVTSSADSVALQSAWRQAAKRSHPDLGGDIEEFQSIEIAYQVLSNPLERRRYDLHRQHTQAFATRQRQSRGSSQFTTYASATAPTDPAYDTGPYEWASPTFAYSAPPNRRPQAGPGSDPQRQPRNPWLVFVAVMVVMALFIAATMLALGSFMVVFGALILIVARFLRPKTPPAQRR